MKKRYIALLLLLCGALGGGLWAVRRNVDQTPPEIKVSKEGFLYRRGAPEAALLEGVSARDDRDGDVTGSLTVETVFFNEAESAVNVVYVAKDSSNNVAKVSQEFRWETGPEDGQELEDGDSAEKEPGEKAALGEEEPDGPEALPSGEGAGQEEREDRPAGTPAPTPMPEGSPVITLQAEEAAIPVGGVFDAVSYVESIEDDQDDPMELWRIIQIEPKEIDVSTPGIREVTYFVVDSDGNVSNRAVLKLTVGDTEETP